LHHQAEWDAIFRIFAVGTALPVLGLAAIDCSRGSVSQFVKRFKAANVWIQRVAGFILLLVGVHEFILYWLI
jgi:cytochrome c biogenesis protein CcdA